MRNKHLQHDAFTALVLNICAATFQTAFARACASHPSACAFPYRKGVSISPHACSPYVHGSAQVSGHAWMKPPPSPATIAVLWVCVMLSKRSNGCPCLNVLNGHGNACILPHQAQPSKKSKEQACNKGDARLKQTSHPPFAAASTDTRTVNPSLAVGFLAWGPLGGSIPTG